MTYQDFEKLKQNKINELLTKVMINEEVIIQWNMYCDFCVNIFNKKIYPMSKLKFLSIPDREKYCKHRFFEDDKYFAYINDQEIISFNEITQYDNFDVDALNNYIANNKQALLNQYNKLFVASLEEIFSTDKEKIKLLNKLIEMKVIDPVNSNWNNIYMAINLLLPKNVGI